MQTNLFASQAASGLIFLAALAQAAVHAEPAPPSSPPSIDGTYALTERVMADGTVLRPPAIVALYTLANGQFDLNLFVKNRDGTVASESTVGRYTFTADKYCEWIVYTIRNNLDKPGVTNEAPVLPITARPSPQRMADSIFRHPAKAWRSASVWRVSPRRSAVNSSIIGRRSDKQGARKSSLRDATNRWPSTNLSSHHLSSGSSNARLC